MPNTYFVYDGSHVRKAFNTQYGRHLTGFHIQAVCGAINDAMIRLAGSSPWASEEYKQPERSGVYVDGRANDAMADKRFVEFSKSAKRAFHAGNKDGNFPLFSRFPEMKSNEKKQEEAKCDGEIIKAIDAAGVTRRLVLTSPDGKYIGNDPSNGAIFKAVEGFKNRCAKSDGASADMWLVTFGSERKPPRDAGANLKMQFETNRILKARFLGGEFSPILSIVGTDDYVFERKLPACRPRKSGPVAA